MFDFDSFAEKGHPLVSDMKAKGVPGVLFEINFSAQCAWLRCLSAADTCRPVFAASGVSR